MAAGGFTVLARGLRKRCPRCGQRRVFDGWFKLKERCPSCSLEFAKEEGAFLGAMVLNYSVGFAAWIAGLVGILIATVPDAPMAPLMLMTLVTLVLIPLWFFPRSKTLWAAIEHLVHRSEPGYTG